ncbi:MAG: hypothetical protein PWQ82_609 [Thermosediminibacterales bacterium]|nr:hypothetical protein [Thermosediminibacterales bacterium]MDK2835535.1 hypothetical protein [Thermosediminibacterales bacterium]
MRGRAYKSPWILLILLVVGLVLGGLIGDVFGGYFPVLNYSKSVGLTPTTLNLSIISLTFGFLIKINLASIIGLFLALLIYRWL